MNLIMDSGAFSSWTKGTNIDINKYIEYISKNIDWIDYIVNLDIIPSSPGQKKISNEDVEKSAKLGWENYQKIKKSFPEKQVIHIFHQNENFKWLKRIVKSLDYIGLSPANDRTTKEKIKWLDECMNYVLDKEGKPIVKFHGFAVTSLRIMQRYPWYSVDSSSWILQAGLGVIYIPLFEKNKWNYLKNINVPISQIIKEKKHYIHLSKQTKKMIKRFLEQVGVKLGKSEYFIENKKYLLKENEKKMTAKTSKFLQFELSNEEMLVERILVEGVRNSYIMRGFVNAYFLNHLERALNKNVENKLKFNSIKII